MVFIMHGDTISDNSSGISYTVAGESREELNGGTISGNGTNYQVSASNGSAKVTNESIYIAPGVLQENTAVL